MFIHIYNKTCHSSIPDSKTAAYGHQSNSFRNMLGQYRIAVISKWHSYLDFADVEINIHGTAGVIELQVPWNAMEFHGTSRVIEISALSSSMEFNEIQWNCSCHRNCRIWNSMEFHGIPWNFSCQWNWRISSSMEFHGIPWISSCQRNCRILSSMELLVSAILAHS